MLHSLSAQVSHYSELIQRNGDWLYAGVYADEAKTGTKDSRTDFQRLIADCRAGKIDMVITKSISALHEIRSRCCRPSVISKPGRWTFSLKNRISTP